jgi:hypothetical protein
LMILTLCAGIASAATEDGKRDRSVCDVIRGNISNVFIGGLGSLESERDQPTWKPSPVKFPDALGKMEQSDFDFYNDGLIDRVYRKYFEDHYMAGTVLLVQHGHSAAIFDEPIGPLEDAETWFIPCQLDAGKIPLKACAPFTQTFDDASFQASTSKEHAVSFRARYTGLTPYRFRGMTFLVAASASQDTQRYIAVLKPKANRTFENVCLLRKKK